MKGQIPLADTIVKECNGFEPRFLFKIFLTGILEEARKGTQSPSRNEVCAKIVEFARDCYNGVSIFNQSPVAAIERLSRDLSSIKRELLI